MARIVWTVPPSRKFVVLGELGGVVVARIWNHAGDLWVVDVLVSGQDCWRPVRDRNFSRARYIGLAGAKASARRALRREGVLS